MKKLKTILIVVLIIGIIIFAIVKIVKSRLNSMGGAERAVGDFLFDTYTVERKNVTNAINTVGQLTSFNIEKLDISEAEKITEILVSEGARVEANQDIMKVTDGSKSRTIKSTISGLFYCVESEESTDYCIYNLDNVGIKLAIPEIDIIRVKLDQEVKIKVKALGKEFTGRVAFISSLPQNERYAVRVKIDYTDELKFGYTATASIITANKENTIAIPYNYLQEYMDGSGYYVFMEDKKDKLERAMMAGTFEDLGTPVEVTEVSLDYVEIVSGLEEGDKIITFGL